MHIKNVPMKKIITLLLSVVALNIFAQPIIDGKYLPVRGTNIQQVYDYTNQFLIPTVGANQTWDYSNTSGNFLPQNTDGPYDFKTMDPMLVPQQYRDSFPGATHASWITGPPILGAADSSYAFFIIDTAGLHTLGFYTLKFGQAGAFKSIKPETNITSKVYYNTTHYDTSVTIGYTTIFNNGFLVPIKIVGVQVKYSTTPGYGTLKTPVATFPDVLLAREYTKTRYDYFMGVNFQTPVGTAFDSVTRYSFMRNNTFASSLLLVLDFDGLDGAPHWARYNLPVDFGSINGTVRDTNGTFVTSGTAMLYRENSNFSKEDILATTPIQNGTYNFDSIPYGQYRIAVRANQNIYAKSLTTYYGDKEDWLTCTTINTFGNANTSGIDIKLLYPAPAVGTGQLIGALYFDYGYTAKVNAAQPIPGIDISAKKNPGGIKSQIQTNGNGQFSLSSLADGVYDLYVDIPGLHHYDTYTITIVNGNTASNLNFTASKDSIYAGVDPNYINSYSNDNSSVVVYPNPFDQATTISVSLKEKGIVSVDVYNLLGEKVSTLQENELKSIGTYNYEFNSAVASGIYFVKLNVNGVTNSFKIVKE